MQRRRRATTIALLLVSFYGLIACGGGGEERDEQVLEYRPGGHLGAQVADGGRDGPVRLERIIYSSADGDSVPALFAIPADREPLGCLMYQGGLGQTKEQPREVREGAASLRLATFTIDPREGGARGGVARVIAATKTPETLRAMVINTVVDLRMGLDYLKSRKECHDKIAYMGTSFGAVVGALFAGQDRRVKAVVLTSVGSTFKGGMLGLSVAAQQIPNLPVMVPGAATDPALLAHAVRILSPYDPVKWVGKIAPRPVMLVNGRFDPIGRPVEALELVAAARDPKTVVYFNGGHDPFAPGPDQQAVALRVAEFLSGHLGLPPPR